MEESKFTREQIEEAVTQWLCRLGNVNNPDKAESAINELIYKHNPPDFSSAKLMALGKAQALFGVLKMFSAKK